MHVGCLFGTFDPPHKAHVAIADHMLQSLSLDNVWLVVTPANPFKKDQRISPEAHRLAMVRIALMRHPGIQASGIELDLPRPNYTVDTLRFMRARWPLDSFDLIIGSDNLASFHTWKHPEEILSHHKLLVYPRSGSIEAMRNSPYIGHPSVEIVNDAPLMDVSSTSIRAAISEWRPVNDMVDPAVLSYIRQHRLYSV